MSNDSSPSSGAFTSARHRAMREWSGLQSGGRRAFLSLFLIFVASMFISVFIFIVITTIIVSVTLNSFIHIITIITVLSCSMRVLVATLPLKLVGLPGLVFRCPRQSSISRTFSGG